MFQCLAQRCGVGNAVALESERSKRLVGPERLSQSPTSCIADLVVVELQNGERGIVLESLCEIFTSGLTQGVVLQVQFR